jgi:AcrR family transcriptional regulator
MRDVATTDSSPRAGDTDDGAAVANGAESGAFGAPGVAGEPLTLPRGRHNLTREQVRSVQRERILAGMVQALAENGYARTTVADVISRSHTSRETFYEHFANKEACFLAAYEQAVDELTGAMRASFAQGGAARARERGRGADQGRPASGFERALGAYLEAMASRTHS